MREAIKKHLERSIQTKVQMLHDENFLNYIEKVSQVLIDAYRDGNKLLIAGNGGSAADSQHIAGELVSKFYMERPALNAIALSVNTSVLTAIGNDYEYERIFARQVEAFGAQGDVFLGISTSGNSKNVIEAIKMAKSKKMKTIGFVGSKSCQMDELCDYTVKIPCDITPIIQESHITIGHIICELVESKVFGECLCKL